MSKLMVTNIQLKISIKKIKMISMNNDLNHQINLVKMNVFQVVPEPILLGSGPLTNRQAIDTQVFSAALKRQTNCLARRN